MSSTAQPQSAVSRWGEKKDREAKGFYRKRVGCNKISHRISWLLGGACGIRSRRLYSEHGATRCAPAQA